MSSKTDFEEYYQALRKDPRMARLLEEAERSWDVAMQVRGLREQAGLTQRQLAGRVGTTQQSISRLEQAGCDNVRLGTLRRVAHALDATVAVALVRPACRSRGRLSRRPGKRDAP